MPCSLSYSFSPFPPKTITKTHSYFLSPPDVFMAVSLVADIAHTSTLNFCQHFEVVCNHKCRIEFGLLEYRQMHVLCVDSFTHLFIQLSLSLLSFPLLSPVSLDLPHSFLDPSVLPHNVSTPAPLFLSLSLCYVFFCLSFLTLLLPLLNGYKVSMLTHTNSLKPLRKINVAICNHWTDCPFTVLQS